MKTYELYEDNAGGLHLAILDQDDNCVYYLVDLDRKLVLDTLDAFKAGSDPIEDGWEGGEPNPQECYDSLIDMLYDADHRGSYVEVDA